MRTGIALSLILSLVVACDVRTMKKAGADSAADEVRAREDSVNRARPGYVVDSILSLDEEMRRFSVDLPTRPARLANGADSREALVRRWIAAVEQNDSLSLIRLAVNRPEFALLIYPSSPYTKSPTRQSPWLVWQQLSDASALGFRRTISRLGGRPLGVVDWSCRHEPEVQGENRIWNECRLRRVVAPGDTVTQQMFGPIIARDGVYKFVTLANEM